MIKINWIEKGFGLIEELESSGISIVHAEGSTYCKQDGLSDLAQSIVNGFDPVPYERKKALARIVSQINEEMEPALNKYPVFEREGFKEQEIEAINLVAGNAGLTPFIDEISLRRGISRLVVASKILTRANDRRMTDKKHSAERQRLSQLVKTETDYSAIKSINFDPSRI